MDNSDISTSNIAEFPKLGVKISFLSFFIESCGGEENIKNDTTEDICKKFVKPQTLSKTYSFCTYLDERKNDSVGESKVFISHYWGYKFIDLCKALSYHFRDNLETIVWIDIFSVNQHVHHQRDFKWWSTTFQNAIADIGYTVVVLIPWSNPTPFTRGWCLWELYCSIVRNCKFEIALSREEELNFFHDFKQNGHKLLYRMLGIINVENSQCTKPDDLINIFKAIESSVAGGFSALNSVVFERLRNWCVEITETEIRKTESNSIIQLLELKKILIY